MHICWRILKNRGSIFFGGGSENKSSWKTVENVHIFTIKRPNYRLKVLNSVQNKYTPCFFVVFFPHSAVRKTLISFTYLMGKVNCSKMKLFLSCCNFDKQNANIKQGLGQTVITLSRMNEWEGLNNLHAWIDSLWQTL